MLVKNGTILESAPELKLLGFTFSEKPDCNRQIYNLIRRATKRIFVLNHYSKFMPGEDLKKLYWALIRSVLEYSGVIYHSQISNYQSNRLEAIQKRCLRMMYGHQKTYGALLKEAELENLKVRREKQFLKFAKIRVKIHIIQLISQKIPVL